MFSNNVEQNSKNLKICKKFLSAVVKANIKQQEIKKMVAASHKFLLEVPSKLEL